MKTTHKGKIKQKIASKHKIKTGDHSPVSIIEKQNADQKQQITTIEFSDSESYSDLFLRLGEFISGLGYIGKFITIIIPTIIAGIGIVDSVFSHFLPNEIIRWPVAVCIVWLIILGILFEIWKSPYSTCEKCKRKFAMKPYKKSEYIGHFDMDAIRHHNFYRYLQCRFCRHRVKKKAVKEERL